MPRRPHQPAGKTSPDIERAIINFRPAREAKKTPDMQYALIGAEAIYGEVPNLVRYGNRHHRHSALAGQTADAYCAHRELNLLPSNDERHLQRLPVRQGRISFIRMVSQHGNLRTLRSDKFPVDLDLKWQYVKATVMVEEQELQVYHQGELIKTFDYKL